MPTQTKNILKGWSVSYDPYTDLFQMHKGNIFKMPKDKLSEKYINGMRFLYEKQRANPVLIEIKEAYEKFGCDITDLKKREIMKIVKPMVEHYI